MAKLAVLTTEPDGTRRVHGVRWWRHILGGENGIHEAHHTLWEWARFGIGVTPPGEIDAKVFIHTDLPGDE